MNKIVFIICFIAVLCSIAFSQVKPYTGDAQVEVGSFYAGLEFHHTCPMIQRVSFFYPSANSLDQSTDYWKRDSSFIMAAGIKAGDETRWLNFEPFEVEYYTYKAIFNKKYPGYDVTIKYEFLKDLPAFVITYNIINRSDKKEFQFYTDIEASLRTSHTYRLITQADAEDKNGINFINYADKETKEVSIFCLNKGEVPLSFSSKSALDTIPIGNNEWWKNISISKPTENKNTQGKAFNYLYKKVLDKDQSLSVVQVIGTAVINERNEIAEDVSKIYNININAYEEYAAESSIKSIFFTGDNWLDNTTKRAKQILAVNKHYIDGTIQPMPCPAEYNFFFTHDVLLTDLAAVNFDLNRVKNDLSYIASHSRADSVIPHAYYWKDTAYVTEYADPDNWNHFWFIIASSKYLLHSGDKELLNKLYPIINKSITLALSSRKGDLMYAKRPDWWDLGNNYGPRAYMTILAAKALNEFIYISSVLNKETDKLQDYSKIAQQLKAALTQKLWDDKQKYLLNILEDGSIDHHYFAGSVLANHFNMIDDQHKKELIQTASEKLLDKKLGIYNAFPMDFHKLISYYKFAGDEAGAEFYYMNGGIWSHENAWYALGLAITGEKDSALLFVKNIMTIDGMLNSPNGQPAMYEVRIPDYKHPNIYGKIDKPQFLWAAGWYLYTLYNLFGVKEENWNITLDPWLPSASKEVRFDITINGRFVPVNIKGNGNEISSLKINNQEFSSLVIPEDVNNIQGITITMGKLSSPIIKSADCRLSAVKYDVKNRILNFSTSSINGNEVTVELISKDKPVFITLNGNKIKYDTQKTNSGYNISIRLKETNKDNLQLQF